MKSILLTVFLFATVVTKAQITYTDAKMPDSLVVLSYTNDMTDKTIYFCSTEIKCKDETGKKGFTLDCFVDKNLSMGDLKVTMVNIGSCVEKNEMIIMFEDGTKITLVSWNEFNCKGNAWFKLSGKNKELLTTKKIKKIQVMNGRSYESFSQELETKDQDFFIRLQKMLDKKETYKYTDK